MTAAIGAMIATLVVAAVVGWGVPALAMKMLWPALADGNRAVVNYSGVRISPGLGIAWLVWALSVYVVVFKASTLQVIAMNAGIDQGVVATLSAWFPWAGAVIATGGSFVFGLIDDAYGGADTRGFRGHLREMFGGRLTTGGLKLIGIGVVAAVSAVAARGIDISDGAVEQGTAIGGWILATLVIALSANLVNLTDLRPGRALKTYIVLAAFGVGVSSLAVATGGGRATGGEGPPLLSAAVGVVLLLGPVVAVWRYDLGEKGMLGDSGANAMGALAGYVLAAGLPVWGLAVTAVLLLALNLTSERVSFSKVIQANAFLRWVDGIGRLRDTDDAAASGAVQERGKEHAEIRKDGGAG